MPRTLEHADQGNCVSGVASQSLAPPCSLVTWYSVPCFPAVLSIWDAKVNVYLTWSTPILFSLGLPLLSCTCLLSHHGILYAWNVYDFIYSCAPPPWQLSSHSHLRSPKYCCHGWHESIENGGAQLIKRLSQHFSLCS